MRKWLILFQGTLLAMAIAVAPGHSAQQDASGAASAAGDVPDVAQESAGQASGQTREMMRPRREMFAQRGDDFGWLGVAIEEVSSAKATELKLPAVRGVLLQEVNPDSPAAKAGLKAGDVIMQFDGQRVEGTVQFRRLVRETPPGRTARITLWRDGKSQSTSVELARAPEREGLRWLEGMRMPNMQRMHRMPGMAMPGFMRMRPTPTLGISALDVSGQLGTYFKVPDGQGILVTAVNKNSPAAKGGLAAGDVITKVNDKRVRDISELRQQLREDRAAKSVSLALIRRGAETTVSVEPEQPPPPRPISTETMGDGRT
jgi:serine protease Do